MEFLREEIARAEDALANRILHPDFDRSTYLRMEYYIEFQETGDVKKIWCYSAASKWRVDPIELYDRAPDHCPVYKTPLDYGLGFNTVLRSVSGRNNDWFRPTVDHIKPKILYPELKYDVNNMIVTSAKFNRHKNDIEHPEELEMFYNGFKETYFK